MKRIFNARISFMTLFLLTACAADDPGKLATQSTEETDLEGAMLLSESPEEPNFDLENTEWVLDSLGGNAPLPGTNLTLSFTNGIAGGFSGCNHYGGPYQVTGNTIQVTEVASNAQECLEREGVMAQESDFQSLLQKSLFVEQKEDLLSLKSQDGKMSLTFHRQVAYHSDPVDLTGGQWVLLSMDGQAMIDGSTITLSFDGERFNGHAGCRDYHGTYLAGPADIQFPTLEMIDTACQLTESSLIQEGSFTDSLSNATHYRLSENQLAIYTAPGGTLLLERPPQ